MADGQLGPILRRLGCLTSNAEAGDASLLERFLNRNDEEAFATLVRRHGPLVMGVCRRVLRHSQDAEDAFQAVFLVLARKAASIRNRESIGSWLYEVAFHVAVKARASAARRRERERRAAEMPSPQRRADEARLELVLLLDEELHQLPDKYRQPLVLCYLQGKTHAQAARELGCPIGSLSRHLARGLELLRERLVQRGLALASSALVVAMTEQSAAATVPAALAVCTARAALAFASGKAVAGLVTAPAAALAKGALKTMLISRFLIVGILLVTMTAGGGAFAYRALLEKAESSLEDPPLSVRSTTPPTQPYRDRYGDPLPEAAIIRLGSIHLRHEGPVTSISLTPNGKTMASVSHDGTIRLWEVATGRKLRQWHAHDQGAFGIAYFPDGTHLVSGGGDKLLRLWDATTGQEIRRFVGHQDRVRCLALSADGRTLASGCGGENFGSAERVIRLWDVATGQELRQCAGHVSGVRALAFAPDGKTLASAGGYWENDLRGQTKPDSKLRLWDVASGAQIHALGDHTDGVRIVAFAPDGKSVVSGDRRLLHTWDVATGKEVQCFAVDRDQMPVGLAFSSDGSTLFSGGGDGTLHEWDVATGKERRNFGAGQVSISALVLTPDGKTIAVGGWEKRVRLWNVETGRETPDIQEHRDSVCAVAFSPNGQSVVTASQDATLRLWDAATGKEIRQFVGHKHYVCAVAFSPDGKRLVSGAYMDETFRIWDVATGRSVYELPIHFKALAVAFSPDSKTVALGGENSEVVLCDVATGKPVRRLNKGNGNWARSLAFSPDGKFLACGDGGPIRLWNLADGTLILRSPLSDFKAAQAAFSPDGRMLATTDNDSVIHLWELATGVERLAFSGHEQPILSLAFSPRGDSLVTGSFDRTVRLWDTQTGKQLKRLTGHTGTVNGVAFAPNGKRVASASRDNTALIWDASKRTLPAPAAGALSPEELNQLWSDLADVDAAKAYRAMASLAAHPAQAVPLMKTRLRSAPPPASGRVTRLIADLDDDEFAVRDRAFRELRDLEEAIEPALRRALEGQPSLETSRQLKALLGRLAGLTPRRLRGLRSVEVLERIATTEARRVLKELAARHSDGPLGQEAKAAMARLGGQ